jgi:NifU-like protein involved in Fe-S cluster formation
MSSAAAQSLYSRDILRLAMELPHDDRLSAPTGSATHRSALCGSEMTVDVAVDKGVIEAVAIRANACALGQASASLLRRWAIGKSIGETQNMAQQVGAALDGLGAMPAEYEVLAYAIDYPARHGAILLPFVTLLAAVD